MNEENDGEIVSLRLWHTSHVWLGIESDSVPFVPSRFSSSSSSSSSSKLPVAADVGKRVEKSREKRDQASKSVVSDRRGCFVSGDWYVHVQVCAGL